MTPVLDFQTRAARAGVYLSPLDNAFGPATAGAYEKGLLIGLWKPGDSLVLDLRQAVAEQVPRQSRLQDRFGPSNAILAPDPKRPGGLLFTDGGDWQRKNVHSFNLPLVGPQTLHRRAVGYFICALADLRALSPYRPGKASSYCLRRKNWSTDPAVSLTTHAHGFALDLDLDQDGKWERVESLVDRVLAFLRQTNPDATREQAVAEAANVVKIMESWGLVWGGRWGGKTIDQMHFQAARVG